MPRPDGPPIRTHGVALPALVRLPRRPTRAPAPEGGSIPTFDPKDASWRPLAPSEVESAALRAIGDRRVSRADFEAARDAILARPEILGRGVPERVDVAAFGAEVPKPPLLDPAESPREHEDRLLKCALVGVDRFYGVVDWALKRAGVGVRETARACAQALVEHDLEPARWVLWSLRQYRERDAFAAMRKKCKNGPPPAAWLLSAARVHKHHGWCRKETAGEFAGSPEVRQSPEARRFAHLQGGLKAQLAMVDEDAEDMIRAGTPASPSEVLLAKVAWSMAYFPGDLRATLLATMETRSRGEAQRLADLVNAGGWPWSV